MVQYREVGWIDRTLPTFIYSPNDLCLSDFPQLGLPRRRSKGDGINEKETRLQISRQKRRSVVDGQINFSPLPQDVVDSQQ